MKVLDLAVDDSALLFDEQGDLFRGAGVGKMADGSEGYVEVDEGGDELDGDKLQR